ncbi:uridine kinase [Anoxybacillus calidus]|uniref:Uridine kinase n=1 Tax=[Anoxybacillus] calidus TaxID=575178 RepID=A0A7V9YX70_9BACL|nr:uridine kinase [Anoxybacillus calidus]
MRRILSLQGGMAAGKTTLAKRLEKRFKRRFICV